jgi:hypothetical protein
LEYEFQVRNKTLKHHVSPMPPKLPRPMKHTLASLHIPPWLDEVQKNQHLKRALEAEGSGLPRQQKQSGPKVSRRGRRDVALKNQKS